MTALSSPELPGFLSFLQLFKLVILIIQRKYFILGDYYSSNSIFVMYGFQFDSNDPITNKLVNYIQELSLGDMAGENGDFREAILHLKNAIRISETERFENLINSSFGPHIMSKQKLSKPYYLIATAYLSLEEYENAIEYYNKTLLIEPLHESSLFYRAICKGYLDKYAEAIIDFDIVLTKNKDNSDAYRFRGLAWLELNDKYRAKSDFEKAAKLGCTESSKLLNEIFGINY